MLNIYLRVWDGVCFLEGVFQTEAGFVVPWTTGTGFRDLRDSRAKMDYPSVDTFLAKDRLEYGNDS